MATELDHIELANRNHETLAYLVKDAQSHAEWVATVAFYKAVQIVEAVLARRGLHSNGHDGRISDLKRQEFQELFKAYRPLYAASLVARYLEDSSARKVDKSKRSAAIKYAKFTDYIPADMVVERLLRKRLDVLEQNAIGFLSTKAKGLLKRVHPILPAAGTVTIAPGSGVSQDLIEETAPTTISMKSG